MNWKRTILCALGTALLVAGGFLLPKAVFAYQDHRFDQASEQYLTHRSRQLLSSGRNIQQQRDLGDKASSAEQKRDQIPGRGGIDAAEPMR